MANWTYDPSQYEEKSFQIIPVGDYRARIADVVEKTFSSGNGGYEITLDINGYNSKVWFYLVLDASNPQQTNQRIGDFFNSFGITNPAMGTGKQWIGSVGAVRIKHDEYQGNTNAKVAYCINRSRQDKLPAWKQNGAMPTNTATSEFVNVEVPGDLPFDV
jgi:hypothetical protein